MRPDAANRHAPAVVRALSSLVNSEPTDPDMAAHDFAPRSNALDPIDRVSEIVFGVLMALTFTGTLSVATAGREEVRTMMLTALGCNLAWGLTDAVMSLVRAFTERRRNASLLQQLHAARDEREAHGLLLDSLPPLIAANMPADALQALHRRLMATPIPVASLHSRDFGAALRIFGLVVLATFPVVVPFIFIAHAPTALRVSNLLALASLFISGAALGHYTSERPWLYGLAMMGIGVALVLIIIALGG
jgi:hypothetical protein